MEIHTLQTGQMETNCYILIDPSTRESLVIDPGDDGQYIIGVLLRLQCKPVRIIATHGHFDHIMAAYELQKTFNIKCFIHPSDRFLVSNMKRSAMKFLKINDCGPAPDVSDILHEGDSIHFGEYILEILHTPGHTPGSISIYSKDERALFSGDLVFSNGSVGRTDFSYSDKKLLVNSLRLLFKLPLVTMMYPGHGSSSTIRSVKKKLAVFAD